ncbi:MAG: phosphocholine cytidylyltransferase family protein [Clostridium sp.]
MSIDIKTAVVLAAGMGTRLRGVTGNKIPKGFLPIDGVTLIERSIRLLRSCGIENVYIVTGNLSQFYEKLAEENNYIVTTKNERYSETGSMASLACLDGMISEDFLLLESDLIYERRALTEAINFSKEDCILVSGKTNSGDEYYVSVKENECLDKASKVKSEVDSIYGEWVGISKVSYKLFNEMIRYYNFVEEEIHYEDAFVGVSRELPIPTYKIEDLIWSEIDDQNHLERVNSLILPKIKIVDEV